jgi:hypothetical protein
MKPFVSEIQYPDNITKTNNLTGIHSNSCSIVYVKYIFGSQYSFIFLFSLALQPSAGYGLIVSRGFLIKNNDAVQSVRHLWTSDQLVAETST